MHAKLKSFYNDQLFLYLVTILGILLSFIALIYFGINNQHLYDYDSIARLNIARRTYDNLVPGLGQLGGVWLPLPQFFMIPFAQNSFLWHSGMAGSIVSMTAFIISNIFIFMTILLITKNRTASLIGWIVYASNINLLILQTSAMSESFFLFTLVMIIYFLTKWTATRNVLQLLFAAFFLVLLTLTRYEGYAIFIASIITVFLCSILIYKRTGKSRIEGTLIIFLTLASMGIIIWTIYSWAIFHDPIYWLNLYTGNKDFMPSPQTINQASDGIISIKKEQRDFIGSYISYGWAASLMVGIPSIIVFIFGYIVFLGEILTRVFKKKSILVYIPILILSSFLFIFLGFGYHKGLIPPIQAPPVSLSTLTNINLNYGSSTNIRYGIIILPFVAIFIGYLASKFKIISILILIFISVQIVTYFKGPYLLTFQLPKVWKYSVSPSAVWFNNHYDKGLVLISAHQFEPFMLQSYLPYKVFIHEGTQRYWTDSVKNPSKYATWIVYDTELKGDYVNMYLDGSKIISNKYNLLHTDKNLQIYKIKTKPDIEIKQ